MGFFSESDTDNIPYGVFAVKGLKASLICYPPQYPVQCLKPFYGQIYEYPLLYDPIAANFEGKRN